MNIQLFFENQEVELNDKVSLPLNKSFENLWNPTDIIIEYSKSIKIPATAANNRLMANAYRIDRQFIINEGNPNIGLYLDPMKRIPMKLIYNGSILLDGYAKYTSATVNSKETYYNFNLYGALGDVFQSLLDCVVDENKLTDEQRAESDGGAKYVIKSPWEKYIINKEFVKESWDKENPTIGYYLNPHDAIGFAPAYRGLYDNFESNSIWVSTLEVGQGNPNVTSVEDYLKKRWITNLKNNGYNDETAKARVDALDFNMILPNGLSEHNMRQFRSYEQKPYIYVHALFDLFRKKCRDLTGYEIKLDPNWFSSNNPYYSNLCYMFDYLSVKGSTLQQSRPFTGYSEQKFKNESCQSTATYTITDSEALSNGDYTMDPMTIGLRIKHPVPSTCSNPSGVEINMRHRSYLTVDMAVTTGGTTSHYYFWGGTGTPSNTANVGPSTGNNTKYPKDMYIYMSEKTQYNKKDNEWEYTGYLTLPSFTIKHNEGDSVSITYTVQFGRDYVAGSYLGWTYSYLTEDGTTVTSAIPPPLNIGQNRWTQVVDNENYKFILPNTSYSVNWRTSTTCELKNLYANDEPLFKVLLQYTKMFGLIWKPDYNAKTIDVMTRSTYFKNYKIIDWTDKIDKTKGITIEPVSFSSKYVVFNYNNVNGNRYSGYRNKYGVDYGEKKLKTNYNFDTKEEDLFKEKIGPSSVSSKSIVDINDLTSWTTIGALPLTEPEVNFIDCENDDEKAAISLNNWYFRLPNKETNGYYYISDISPVELEDGKCYWINNVTAVGQVAVVTQTLPQFSPVITKDGITVGCLFNCPNEDYTKDKKISMAKGNYVYDNCWADYINERYNANNKKITCYANITPIEFEQFNFKKFVVVDNQMFVVNKIFDYDTNNPLTKVELIQVTNINGYVKQNMAFSPYIFDSPEIYITPSAYDRGGYYGHTSYRIIGYPMVTQNEDYNWWIETINVDPNSRGTFEIEGGDYMDGYVYEFPIYYYSDTLVEEEYALHITALGEEKIIPIYITK